MALADPGGPRNTVFSLPLRDPLLPSHVFSVPPHLMSQLLHKGTTVIRDYLSLIEEFYEDSNEIRTHLQLKGVKSQTTIC